MLQVFGRNRKSRIFVIRELFQNRFSYRLYTMVFLRRNLLCDRESGSIGDLVPSISRFLTVFIYGMLSQYSDKETDHG